LTEEQLRVLKAMSEITSRIDLNAFSERVGLTPDQTIERVQELVDSGLVRKSGGGYGITEKGKAVLKAVVPVPQEAAFHFYLGVGQPTGFSAESLKDFYEIVKRVAVGSLEFHLYRGDFESWVKAAFGDEVLVGELVGLKGGNVRGEELRQGILRAMAAEFGF
jgi:DNA-binding Lrp family transcriptional regulator